ncbi:MAG: transposase [Roseibium album]|uniref:REP-associated tyrosine transposase n=1 Tax=Roseibium album TaxID=311410 RepID=UPI0032EDB6DE
MGQRNLRKGRISEPQRLYLVTTATRHRRPVFHDLDAGRAVVHCLRWSDERGRTGTWAFVVMPDHLHWLLELKAGSTLSGVVASVKKYSSRQISAQQRIEPPIWQPGFHDHALRQEEEVRSVARYVVMNPVRAGLVTSVRDYPLWDARWI